MDRQTDSEVHRPHVRKVLTLIREHKLYANLKKFIFAASEIPLLGCIVDKHGFQPDPEKIKAITDWPVPTDIKGLRKFLGLAAYLHKYSHNYAEMTVHLSRLLKKEREVSMECWLPALLQRYQARLDTLARFDNCRPRQTILGGLRCK